MKKNSILTFLFACIPGAGQMYYGYMRRGLSVAIVFWLGCVVGIWLLCAQFIGPILSDLLYWLGVEYQYIDYYLNQIPTLVVAGVLIWLGLRMLRRSKNQPGGGDLPPYPGEHCDCDHDHTDRPEQ